MLGFPWNFLLNKYVLGGLAIALIIGGLALAHSNYVDKLVDDAVAQNNAKWQAAIDKQKAEARAKLEEVIAANAEKERADLEHALQLETAYATHVKSLKTDLSRALASGKLHDPGFKGCGPSNSSAPAETKADTPVTTDQISGGELSDQASEFLRREADRADQVALVANTCLSFIHGE